MTDLMRSGTGQPQFLAGKWRQKNPRTYLCQAHAGIYDYSAFSFLVLALIPDCSALRAPTILSLMSLYASIFRFPISLSTTRAFVREPVTLIMVLAISMIGSIAKIGLTIPNWAPMPTPESPTEAAIVAVPGIPAIPREPIVTTKIVITIIVISIGVPVTLQT